MKSSIQRFLLFLAAFTSAFAQPMVPVNNISPVATDSLVGKIGASGRAQSIPLGSGLSFVGGALTSSGGSGGAPVGATYILKTANATLTNSQALSGLSSGPMLVANGTGNITSVLGTAPGQVLTYNGTTWNAAAPAAGGNVTAAGTLDSGNIVIGQGTKAVATSNVFNITGSNATLTGNLAVTGGMSLTNLTTGNLTVTANILSTTVTDGQFFIGNNTGDRLQLGTIVAGDNITVTPGAGTIMINATGGSGGTVTVSGTPTSGQLAQWSSATNIVGIASANVTQGGTGVATLTANAVITGNGTGAVTSVAPGTNGNILTSNGTAWTSAAPGFGTGNVTSSGTPTAAQTAEFTTATNIVGVANTGTGSYVKGTSPAFTTNLTLANGASPSTGVAAAVAFDTDAWAASRGAIQVHDGTANTFLVGALASDTPSNGQVPTWNTGGTVTWETPGGGGTPGGSTTQVQYNNAGAFGGISGATSDGTNMTFGSSNLRATSPRITTAILDANGNEVFITPATASAVNEITVTNAATGDSPSIAATGGDTNIDLLLSGKAGGGVRLNSTDIPQFKFTRSGTVKGIVATSGSSSAAIIGASTDDLCLVSQGFNFRVSTNSGSSTTMLLNTSGQLSITASTASTSTTTGSLVNAGGFGNAGQGNFGGTIFSPSVWTGESLSSPESLTPKLQVIGQGSNDFHAMLYEFGTTAGLGPTLYFRRARGTASSFSAVQQNDALGQVTMGGAYSTGAANWAGGTGFSAYASENWDASHFGTYFTYSTTIGTTTAERMRLSGSGNLLVGTVNDTGLTGAGGFRVGSTTASTSTTTGAALIDGGLGVAGATYTSTLAVTSGVTQAGGMKHARVTTGSVSAGSTALVTITWGTTFADANYTVSASVVDSTTSSLALSVVHIESISASAVTVRVLNNAVGSLTGTVHCIALHD